MSQDGGNQTRSRQRFQGCLVIQLSLPKHMVFFGVALVQYRTPKIDRYWYQSFAVTLVMRPIGCRRPQLMAFVGRM